MNGWSRVSLRGLQILGLSLLWVKAALCGGEALSGEARRLNCGGASVYVILRMLGRPVSADEVIRDLGALGTTASFSQIRSFLKRKGVNTKAYHCSVNEIRDILRVPIVAQVRVRIDGKDVPHFIPIIGKSKTEGVRIIDTVWETTDAQWMDWKVLDGMFEGNVIVLNDGEL